MSANINVASENRVTAVTQTEKATAVARSTQRMNEEHLKDKSSDVKSVKELEQARLRGEEIPISREQLLRAIEKATEAIQGPDKALDFSIHEKTNKIIVKVINKESGEIIREIPPEKTLDLLASLWEMAGILIDERR